MLTAYQVREGVTVGGVVEVGEEVNGELSGTDSQPDPVAHLEVSLCVGDEAKPAGVEAAVESCDRGVRPFDRPAHPGGDHGRRCRSAEADDEGAAQPRVVRRCRVDGVITRLGGGFEEGGEALADGVVAVAWDTADLAADLIEAQVVRT